MKPFKFILYIPLMVVFVCIVTLKANAQIIDTSLFNKYKADADKYFKEAHGQKRGGIIALIGGGAMLTTGLIIENNGDALDGAIPIVIGASFIITSIPMFISSAYYKNKANLILKNENVFFNPQSNIKTHFASVGIKINF